MLFVWRGRVNGHSESRQAWIMNEWMDEKALIFFWFPHVPLKFEKNFCLVWLGLWEVGLTRYSSLKLPQRDLVFEIFMFGLSSVRGLIPQMTSLSNWGRKLVDPKQIGVALLERLVCNVPFKTRWVEAGVRPTILKFGWVRLKITHSPFDSHTSQHSWVNKTLSTLTKPYQL